MNCKIDKNTSLNDFLMLSVIGKGSYAKVVLVKRKDSGEIMALKIVKKETVAKKKQEEHLRSERDVLVNAQHPFITKLYYAFQNERRLYFALEYCPGGELFTLLKKKEYFTEDQTRFYAVQIVLSLEYLHSMDVIYRDLKPENVLIDQYGYIKITDFGLSKRNVKGQADAFSVCGTPEYLAPEVLLKKGHGKAVDWWTLGSIIYEMMTGFPAFYSDLRDDLFEQINSSSVKYPSNFSVSLRSLLEGLLQKDPEKRLGGGLDGAKSVKAHSWFKGIDWDLYLKRGVRPPFVPVLSNALDVSNFDPEFTDASVDSYQNSVVDYSFNKFEGFTYEEGKVM